ncbi:MAG: chitobiase/beta-hexosaminidase C-terminal domain-containing protein, partial [Muribaculaceae bacterium]|nr:chitobiase/beta-hexosaminidase C-terminal domain-containing protein [Muribaculaceae bacterium]
MKKSYLLLFLTAMFMAVGAKAVTVDYTGMTTHNPFAYDVTATKTSAGVDVTYKLVGRPTAVSVELYKDGQLVKAVDGDITANVNTASIPMADLATGTYKVAVKVTGSAVSAPTLVKDGNGTNFEYKFYAPWGVACNNATESPTFGRVVTVESWYLASDISSAYMSGQGNGIGMGLYPFTPTFEPIKNSNNTYGFAAGMTAVDVSEATARLDLKRVRYSDDGRLFVGRSNSVTSPIYEVDPNDFNAAATPVFTGTQFSGTTDLGTEGGKIYTDDTKTTFVTGPCMGFDVIGSGADLKLIMVSQTINIGTNGRGAVSMSGPGAGAYGYNLGTATTWNQAPSFNTRTVNPSDPGYWINDNNDLAIGDGFFHIAQYRGSPSATQPSHVAYNMSGQRSDLSTAFVSRGCGMAFNKDRARLAKGTAAKTIGIFTPGANGVLGSAEYSISIDGTNVSGLAWDYADNLYVSTNSTEWVHCYAMPRSSNDVTTPARAEYDINWESSVPEVYILGTVNGNAWAPNVGVQMTYDATSSSYTATVTAGAGGASFNMATALGADSNWDNFNGNNYRWGVSGGYDYNVTDAEYGTTFAAQMWDYNPGAWVVPEGEYNITWKFTGEYTATLVIEKIEPVPDVYILGQVNGNAWAPNVGVEMTYDEATGLHSADVFVCKASDSDNYGYFSFTTALAEEGGDAHWADIASNRFGAVSEGDFLVDPYLGQEISLTATNGQSLKCTAGYYTVTVDYKNMKAVVSAKSFAPSFNPEPGEYYKVVNIDIASEAAPDADIYVTFHGETPTTESFQLTKALTLTHSYTVKAIAVKYGIVSDVA